MVICAVRMLIPMSIKQSEVDLPCAVPTETTGPFFRHDVSLSTEGNPVLRQFGICVTIAAINMLVVALQKARI